MEVYSYSDHSVFFSAFLRSHKVYCTVQYFMSFSNDGGKQVVGSPPARLLLLHFYSTIDKETNTVRFPLVLWLLELELVLLNF